MKSLRFPSFNKAFDSLPKDIQELATEQFKKWKNDPQSLTIKPLDVSNGEVVSCQINYRYRALACKVKDKENNTTYVWFWAGSHEDYNKLVTKKSHLIASIQGIRKKYSSNCAVSKTPVPH